MRIGVDVLVQDVEKFEFAVTYDYRCPFARNLHEHLVAGLKGGADWTVTFVPFSLSQAHVEEGELAVWDDPAKTGEVLAMEAGLVVREQFADRFLDFHLAMFAARHDRGFDLRDEQVVREVLEGQGLEADAIFKEINQGWPAAMFKEEHERAVREYHVFGVPTYIFGSRAAFVRVMSRPNGDPNASRMLVEKFLFLLLCHRELNEFKLTTIER